MLQRIPQKNTAFVSPISLGSVLLQLVYIVTVMGVKLMYQMHFI